jgi:arylsulfatase A-like enzyme
LTLTEYDYAPIRTDDFKYFHFNGGLPPLLYDMSVDPHEFNNIVDDSHQASQMAQLAHQMLDHRMTFAHHAMSGLKLTEQ